MNPTPPLLVVLALAAFTSPVKSAEDGQVLAKKAQAVLQDTCLKCHASAASQYFDVRDRATLLAPRKGKRKGVYVVPGKPDESYLWELMADDDALMPQDGSEERKRIRQADRDIVKAWIAAGAPEFPKEPQRKFIPLEATLKAIRDHSLNAGKDAAYYRYFTLTNLHNDNKHVTAADLRITQAAVSKALNSLSWKQEIIVPEIVAETEGTVLAVNIQKLGWTREMWNAVASAYPYGLGYEDHANNKLKGLDDNIRKLVGTEIAVQIRADWFVATATRPPLYHKLLFDFVLPELVARKSDSQRPDNPKQMTVLDLEKYLGVDATKNLLKKTPEVIRAGFPGSGVSGQNRLLERHPLRGQGAYWKSYDFKSSTWEANLQQFPLGPIFEGNPYPKHAFKQDGGEMIFHLPNGLQGYLLVDGKDSRIDAGPIEVVSDREKTSGTPVVVNGISCMACHKDGMRTSPPDQVRAGKGVFGAARQRVEELYPPTEQFNKQVEDDRELFLKSLEKAVGPFLRVDDASKTRPIASFVGEPIGLVARRYAALDDDLDVSTVANELHLSDPKEVVAKAANSDIWRQLGLGALAAEGGRIKRGAWESVRGTSLMQQAAREFGFSPR